MKTKPEFDTEIVNDDLEGKIKEIWTKENHRNPFHPVGYFFKNRYNNKKDDARYLFRFTGHVELTSNELRLLADLLDKFKS